MKFQEIELSGFGRYPKAKCRVSKPASSADIKNYLVEDSVMPRGLGRSYGDASLNDKGFVAETLLLNRFLSFDESIQNLI